MLNRDDLLRERLKLAADEAAKLSLRLTNLSRKDGLCGNADSEKWLRSIESDLQGMSADTVRWLEKYALPAPAPTEQPKAREGSEPRAA